MKVIYYYSKRYFSYVLCREWFHKRKLNICILLWIDIMEITIWFQKGKLKGVLFICFASFSLYVSISLCQSRFLSVFLFSLKAIHILRNNPYKHLFLFMSLSFTPRCSTHANVNSEIGPPWGSFTHHTCEQKTNPCFSQSSWLPPNDTLLKAFTLLSPWIELP